MKCAVCSLELTVCDVQQAAYSVKLTECGCAVGNMQCEAHSNSVQQAVFSVKITISSVQQAVCSVHSALSS